MPVASVLRQHKQASRAQICVILEDGFVVRSRYVNAQGQVEADILQLGVIPVAL